MLHRLQLEAFLAEYKKLQGDILELEREIHELSVYSLASIAGIATLVVTLMSTDNADLLPAVLLVLPLPFTAMLFSFVGRLNRITHIGQYVGNHIEPGVNSILRSSSGSLPVSNVLQWESYLHTDVRGADKWLADGLWGGGQAALILLPLIGSLVAYFFVVTEAQLTIRSWWVLLLVFDFVLLTMALLAAIVTIARRGLIGKEKGIK